MCAGKKKPNAGDVVGNLLKPMPLGKKFSLFFKNSAYKLLKFKSCCNHPGEPGC